MAGPLSPSAVQYQALAIADEKGPLGRPEMDAPLPTREAGVMEGQPEAYSIRRTGVKTH